MLQQLYACAVAAATVVVQVARLQQKKESRLCACLLCGRVLPVRLAETSESKLDRRRVAALTCQPCLLVPQQELLLVRVQLRVVGPGLPPDLFFGRGRRWPRRAKQWRSGRLGRDRRRLRGRLRSAVRGRLAASPLARPPLWARQDGVCEVPSRFGGRQFNCRWFRASVGVIGDNRCQRGLRCGREAAICGRN